MNAYLQPKQNIKYTMTHQKAGRIHNHNIVHVVLLITEKRHIAKVAERRWKMNANELQLCGRCRFYART